MSSHLTKIPRSFGAHRLRQRIYCRIRIYSKVTTCRENEFETANWRLVRRKKKADGSTRQEQIGLQILAHRFRHVVPRLVTSDQYRDRGMPSPP